MAGRYKAYPAYKKINIETVKELPEKWVMKSLGLLALNDSNSFVDGPFGSDLKSTEYEDFGIPLIQLNNIKVGSHALQNMKYISESKKNELLRHVAKPNDIVIAKMAEPVARAALVNGLYDEYVIVADCVRLSVNQVICNLNYVVYAINSKEINSLAELASSGTTRIRINLSELKKLKIPFPSFSEQQTIAQFLDYETAKIDALIAKQEQLIELLKEKRQAVISHAVTKGLNPDAPMKDSGVEWLGQVPEHWQVWKLSHAYSTIGSGTTPPTVDQDLYNGDIPWVTTGELRENIIFDTSKKVSDATILNYPTLRKYPVGSVLIAMYGATIGRLGILGVEATTNQACCVLPFSKVIINKYTFYWLLAFKEEIIGLSSGGGQPNINQEKISNLRVSAPDIVEQKMIVEYLEIRESKMEEIIKKSLSSIQLLQERKTALISAAVTGKIDVRDWQSPSVG